MPSQLLRIYIFLQNNDWLIDWCFTSYRKYFTHINVGLKKNPRRIVHLGMNSDHCKWSSELAHLLWFHSEVRSTPPPWWVDTAGIHQHVAAALVDAVWAIVSFQLTGLRCRHYYPAPHPPCLRLSLSSLHHEGLLIVA